MPESQGLLREIEPVIRDLAAGINDIIGQLKQLQSPLSESRSKVPKATEQLDKISEQTEQATHQMLDQIEKITQREQEVIEGLNAIKKKADSGEQAAIVELADVLIGKADESCNDAFDIMNTLQFQDITSQQIDHAASLLEEIESKLHQIITILPGGGDQPSMPEIVAGRKTRVYDPHADTNNKMTEQRDIDTLFAQKEGQ